MPGYGSKKAGRPHLYEDWQAVSAEVVTASRVNRSAAFPNLWPTSDAYVRRLEYLVTGPAAMTGPHWNTFRDASCVGRSPLLVAHQLAALPFFESAWKQNSSRYGDACRFLQEIAAEHSLDLFNSASCAINATSSNLHLWISRIPRACFVNKTVQGCKNRRDVSNGLQLAAALSKHSPQPLSRSLEMLLVSLC